jgi:hypothetical protein
MPARNLAQFPPLSSAEKEIATRKYLSELQRELIVRGDDSPETDAILKEVAQGLDHTPTGSGVPETRFTGAGGRMRVNAAADYVANEAAARAKLASFGPDPVGLLEKRLVALGHSPNQAKESAAGRVRRLEDGQVMGFHADGRPMHPEKPKLQQRFDAAGSPVDNSPAELEQHRSPKQALELATRSILSQQPKPELQVTLESKSAEERYGQL